jgi:regulator of Ty1 transposition protein 103
MSFNEPSLLKKLAELTSTQQSVQTLSLWLIHHRRHSKHIVSIWLDQLKHTDSNERKLTLIYLANDILQNSRKKGDEYLNEFSTVLNEAIQSSASTADDKTKFTLERILNIWKDRKIYPDKTIDKFKATLHSGKNESTVNILSTFSFLNIR